MGGIAPVRQSDRLVEFTAKALATMLYVASGTSDIATFVRCQLHRGAPSKIGTVPNFERRHHILRGSRNILHRLTAVCTYVRRSLAIWEDTRMENASLVSSG